MRILILNGPNLNLIGKRETQIYGSLSLDVYFKELEKEFPAVTFSFYQSNLEGSLIDQLQQAEISADAIILNAGGYSHTSVAIADAIAAINTPVVEVHLSNIHNRETYRQHSLTGSKAKGVIAGFGADSYRLGVVAAINLIEQKEGR